MRTERCLSRSEWSEPAVARIEVARADQCTWTPVTWGVTGTARDRLVQALVRSDDPLGAPEGPWAAVIRRPNGAIAATASPTLPGGLTWTIDSSRTGDKQLVIGHDVGAVVRARSYRTELDGGWLRARLSGFLRSEGTTPYQDVHHLPFGMTAVWQPGSTTPRINEWFGPRTMPDPSLRGPDVESTYIATFDDVIDELTDPGRPIAATLSGGLDSSFVVASLVRNATPDNPVHCYTHSPHPDAGLTPVGNWDPDDHEFALAMQCAYPDRVVVHRVINEALTDPLDFIIEASLAGWVPNFNTNGMWMRAMSDDAAERGAAVLFHGTNGNSAFSYDHPYAARHYLRRRELRSAAQLLGPDARQGRSWLSNIRVQAPALGGYRRRQSDGPLPSYLAAVGLGHLAQDAPLTFPSVASADRDGYLSWLTRAHRREVGPSPLAWRITHIDPFATRRICELAASIEPGLWRRGSLPRGFARNLGADRVPDQIRLRTRRGSQSADLWYATRNFRDRYLDEIDLLPTTPYLGGWVDHRALRREVATWPWSDATRPPGWSLKGLHHVLGLAGFIRGTAERLLGSHTINIE